MSAILRLLWNLIRYGILALVFIVPIATGHGDVAVGLLIVALIIRGLGRQGSG